MDFLKRHRTSLIAVVAVLVAACFFGASLASADQAVPENPAAAYDETASAVAWTGQGWTAPIDDQTVASDADEREDAIVAELPPEPPDPEEQTEEQPPADAPEQVVPPEQQTDAQPSADAPEENAPRNDRQVPGDNPTTPGDNPGDDPQPGPGPDNPESDSGEPVTVEYDDPDDPGEQPAPPDTGDDEGPGPGEAPPEEQEPEPGPVDPDEGRYPIVEVYDLADGEEIGQDWRTFTVRATDYAGRTIGSAGIRVTVASGDGEPGRLYATSDDGYEVRYRLPVDARNVAVSIRATDPKGRSTIVDLTVHRAEEDAELVVDGSVTLSLEAGTVGLGTLYGPVEVEFYEGEQMSSVFQRAMQQGGFGVIYKGKIESGYYIQHITRAGITDGWEIPAALQAHLDEVGATITDYHEDSLGEYDFTGTAGWMYSVNDVLMSTNMSNYYPADGDEVRVRFTLYRGSDIGGDDGPQWDEEW